MSIVHSVQDYKSRKEECYVACDSESDGPIPGPYSMLSLGMSVVGRRDLEFYTELQPISEDYDARSLAVSGLDRGKLKKEAPTPEAAMAAANKFIGSLWEIGRPVMVAGPAVWDGMWIHWYFIRFLKWNPFGVTGSGIDLRSYVMGRRNSTWGDTGNKRALKYYLGLRGLRHTHHALEDARELALIFEKILERRYGR